MATVLRWLDIVVYLVFLAFAALTGPRGAAWYVGLCLALLGWGALIICLVVVVIEIVRARREEHVLAETFGPEYAAYRSKTWF